MQFDGKMTKEIAERVMAKKPPQPKKPDYCNCSRFPHERGKSSMCRYYKTKVDYSRGAVIHGG